MDGARCDAVAGLVIGALDRIVGEPEAAVDHRRARDRAVLAAEAVFDLDRTVRGPRAAASAARSRTRVWARRTLAGARSPVRDSSLPAMWSWVTRIARSPSSSASATAIGPPIGSNTTIVAVVRQRDEPAPHVGDVDHGRHRDRRRSARPGREPVHCTITDPRSATRQLLAEADARRRVVGSRVRATRRAAARAGDGRDAAERGDRSTRSTRVAARGRDARRLQPGRTAADHDDRVGEAAGAYQSGSSVSRPLVGSPTHVTIGLRTSRTWQVWLQRMHGRISSAVSAASFATSSGSAIWARVISTRVAHGRPIVVAADRPLGLAPVDDRALEEHRHVDARPRTARHRSMLKPVGSWKSGRVFSDE